MPFSLPLRRLGGDALRVDAAFREMHQGDIVTLGYIPPRGCVSGADVVCQGVIEDAVLHVAAFSVWSGARALTEALKNALVGVDKH